MCDSLNQSGWLVRPYAILTLGLLLGAPVGAFEDENCPPWRLQTIGAKLLGVPAAQGHSATGIF